MSEFMQGRRKHKLFPKELLSNLPPLYSQEENPDPLVHASYFCPYSQGRWLVLEGDPSQRTLFGFAQLFPGCGELGYINMDELEQTTVMQGQVPAIERDLSFQPAPLTEVKERLGL